MNRVLVATLLLVGSASAFMGQLTTPTPHTNLAAMDRRHFLESSAAVAVSTFFVGTMPALALEDLGELTPEEKEAAEKAAYEERLRRKAELQKKAAKSNNFSDGLKGELAKQKELNSKTKEERRNALCEELGRGC